ncbi:ACP S-malonyltransferase [Rhodoblastus sp. 17X3]|uniref:ACP S-malonyltransferase n=1 Tax=Rhodoblastus sp. 17X3 TaxID=3047026 RepID=UPI0024B677EE|nr:ACP S-malonyltransferase [Rhodoblastus sp. 17X3]MDI9847208.1 ACP S-malonyltransferase [Rhodoblastus sp. 17X3]
MTVAFLFPGQGSQAVGMGKALYEAFAASRDVFQEVDEALGEKLSTLMFEGDPAQLQLTANAQPTLMAVSLAALRALEAEKGVKLARDARFVAGHSLGEYSALAAAGALTVSDAARLLRLRGQAMQKAVPVGEGAMAALLGAEPELAAKIAGEATAASGSLCEVANDNGGGQIVVSGAKQAVDLAIEIAKENGIKRAMLLPVSAPFHCALMAPAAEAMRAALAETSILPPVVDVVANVTAAPVRDPDEIRKLLVAQVCGTVRWRECMGYMHRQGVDLFVEIGAGKVLAGLVKRTAEGARALNVGVPADVESFSLTV